MNMPEVNVYSNTYCLPDEVKQLESFTKDLMQDCQKYKAVFLRAIETVNAMQGEIDELQAEYDNIKDHMIEAVR